MISDALVAVIISVGAAFFAAVFGYAYMRDMGRVEKRLDTVERTVVKDRHYMKSFETWVRLTFERHWPGSMKDFPKRPEDEE